MRCYYFIKKYERKKNDLCSQVFAHFEISNFDSCLTESTLDDTSSNVKLIVLAERTSGNKQSSVFRYSTDSTSKMMFGRKKTKLDVSLPKPPTKAEILEDLGAFCMDLTLLDAAKRRTSTTTAAVGGLASLNESQKAAGIEQDVDLERWWNKFEKFLDEVNDVENHQKLFDAKRNNLEKLDSTIRVLSQDVQTQIGKSVQSALEEAADDGSDLK